MELRQLRVFVAIAEEGTFTAASDRLMLVQSAVSATIRALERELGTALFERTTRRVELTDAGKALLPEARATLEASRLAVDAVDQVKGGVRGTVSIGIMQATASQTVSIPRLIGGFQAEHPLVTVTVRHVGRIGEHRCSRTRRRPRHRDPVIARGLCRGATDGARS